jgi:hypothetical protein
MDAAAVLPPERAGLEGCAALGGRSMMGSPRGFRLGVNNYMECTKN